MPDSNKKSSRLLDEGDLGEILLGAATTGELLGERLDAYEAARRQSPRLPTTGRPPSRIAAIDRSAGKAARKLLTKFSPFEILLSGAEVASLASPKVRKDAIESVEKMATSLPGDRFLKGFADPAKTAYGISSALANLFDTTMSAAERRRKIEAELLRRKRAKAAAQAPAKAPFLDPSRSAPLPTAALTGPTPEMMRILQEEVRKRQSASAGLSK